MSLVVPDDGELLLLQYLVNISRDNTDHPVLHLYTNDIDPEDGSHGASGEDFDATNFTEATESGYAAITLTGTNWTTEQTVSVSKAVYNSGVTFTFTQSVDLYGYYVTDTSGDILWAERFPGAPVSFSGGGDAAIQPQITLA